MIAFVDSSVLLRRLFGEPKPLEEWPKITRAYCSRLFPIEVARVIDRARLAGAITDDQVADLHDEARRVLRSIEVLALSERVLERAARPAPTTLGTLDSLHLATALELAASLGAPIVVATHDAQLARAARASDLEVCGA